MNSSRHTVIFRTVAGNSVGLGHVTRCMSLAQALHKYGVSTFFALVAPDQSVKTLLHKAGIRLLEMPEGLSSEKDLAAFHDYCEEYSATATVLDGYQFDDLYLERLSNSSCCLFIDDLRQINPASRLVLNQNPMAKKDGYPRRSNQRLLLGLAYALLRPEFQDVRDHSSVQTPESASRLLITFGGSDPNGLCARTLTCLSFAQRTYNIKIILGGSTESMAAAKIAAEQSHHQVEMFERVPDMVNFISWADFALCGSGVTSYEMCCLGLPMVVVTPVDNQIPISSALEKMGLIRHLGWWEDVDCNEIAQAVDALAANRHARDQMGRDCQGAVDGMGADRVAQALLEEAEKWPN